MSSGQNGSRLEDRLRLVIVDSPHVAAPLVGALEVADIGAWMWVEAECALYFSPRVSALLGLQLEPASDLPRRFLHSVHPEDQESVARLLRRELPAGTFELRYRFTPPGGPLRWIEDRGRVERDSSHGLIRQGGVMRDVTWEVGREQERREADARLEALVNAMPFSVWGRSGPNLTVTHQNAHSIAWWGDLRGQPLTEASPELRRTWEPQIADVMTGQIVRARRVDVRQGETRVLNEIIAPVVVENEITGIVGVGMDVTEEERGRRFEALLTEISTDFASRSTDTLDGALTRALERLARFLGAPVAVLAEISDSFQIRLTHWWIDRESGRERPRLIEFDGTPLRPLIDQLAHNQSLLVRSSDELPAGSEHRDWLERYGVQSFAMVPMREADGTIVLLALSGLRDRRVEWRADTIAFMRVASALLSGVLARIRAEANQKLVERRMQEAQKLESLGVLAGGIAHDFNNLLTAILGNASLLHADVAENPALAGPLDQIEAASRRAAELCRQMLAYAGRGRFSLQPIDLNHVVQGTQALMQVSVPKKATLEVSLAPELPAVLADEAQIRQLLMNLLINAAEAIGDRAGHITITTSAGYRKARELMTAVFSPELTDGEYVSLRVTDSGEGMAAETVGRIFDPFFTTRFVGRGLGLAAVVGIVRAHKGALRVESEYGTGSTFELLLPTYRGNGPSPHDVQAAADASHAGWRSTGTALVIDDEAGVRDLVRNVLERIGFTVVLADDGRQGVAAFRQAAADVRIVIVDLTMPGLDGREALQAIRAIRPEMPAILMSGYTPRGPSTTPAQVFLQKPFTPAALRAAVRQILGE